MRMGEVWYLSVSRSQVRSSEILAHREKHDQSTSRSSRMWRVNSYGGWIALRM